MIRINAPTRAKGLSPQTKTHQLLLILSASVLIVCSVDWSKSLESLMVEASSTEQDASLVTPSSHTIVKRFLSLSEPVVSCVPPTGLIISEFRLRGANGINDEFVEFYNNTDQNITICTADGSPGWALVSSDAIVRFVIATGTVIPARAHYLVAGSGYGLNSYATPDLTYSADTPDNLGLALFNSSSPINFTTANRLDAVGFTTVSSLYREGTGLALLMTTNGQYSFLRKLTSGFPQDTGDNVGDFTFVATDAGNYGGAGPAILGAPGPEGLNSPLQRNSQLPLGVLDPAVGPNVAPNRVRDTAAVGPNAALGTLTIRRKITILSENWSQILTTLPVD